MLNFPEHCKGCFFYDDNNHVCYHATDKVPYPCKQEVSSVKDNRQDEITCFKCPYNDCCYSDDCRHLK